MLYQVEGSQLPNNLTYWCSLKKTDAFLTVYLMLEFWKQQKNIKTLISSCLVLITSLKTITWKCFLKLIFKKPTCITTAYPKTFHPLMILEDLCEIYFSVKHYSVSNSEISLCSPSQFMLQWKATLRLILSILYFLLLMWSTCDFINKLYNS